LKDIHLRGEHYPSVPAVRHRAEVLQRHTQQGRAVQVDPIKPGLIPRLVAALETKMWLTTFKRCFQIELAPLQQGRGDEQQAPVTRTSALFE
jgi:hypothetical protein